jgi:hypothetical protein
MSRPDIGFPDKESASMTGLAVAVCMQELASADGVDLA